MRALHAAADSVLDEYRRRRATIVGALQHAALCVARDTARSIEAALKRPKLKP
jgi:hypothetical protein